MLVAKCERASVACVDGLSILLLLSGSTERAAQLHWSLLQQTEVVSLCVAFFSVHWLQIKGCDGSGPEFTHVLGCESWFCAVNHCCQVPPWGPHTGMEDCAASPRHCAPLSAGNGAESGRRRLRSQRGQASLSLLQHVPSCFLRFPPHQLQLPHRSWASLLARCRLQLLPHPAGFARKIRELRLAELSQ